MKTKKICALLLVISIAVSCGQRGTNEKTGHKVKSDSIKARLDSINLEKITFDLNQAEEFAKFRKAIPKNLTADSVARTLFYVLDSVNIPFSEASIELSTVHNSSYSGGASFIIGYEYSSEKERSGTVTYNFTPKSAKLNTISKMEKAAATSSLWGIFKKRRQRALEKVNLSSSLITAIKDAVDSKTKINNLANEKYSLKDFEIELSFVITNTHDGKLEFKLWDLIEAGGGGSLENSFGHKITIKFDN